jgi:hypothetical protein
MRFGALHNMVSATKLAERFLDVVLIIPVESTRPGEHRLGVNHAIQG